MTVYHRHQGQISNSYEGNQDYVRSLGIILDEHRDLFRRDRKAWADLLNQIGYYQMSCGEAKAAMRSLLGSIAHRPWQKPAYLMLARMARGWDRSNGQGR